MVAQWSRLMNYFNVVLVIATCSFSIVVALTALAQTSGSDYDYYHNELYTAPTSSVSSVPTLESSLTVTENASAQCVAFEEPQKYYFNLCWNSGYENVCLNKKTGAYQGCTRNAYNDCTLYNANRDINLLCKSSAQTIFAPTTQAPSVGPIQSLGISASGDCYKFQGSSEYYSGLCAQNGYDFVCLNKTTGAYQGCVRSIYNDCTLYSSNAESNMLCEAKSAPVSPTTVGAPVGAMASPPSENVSNLQLELKPTFMPTSSLKTEKLPGKSLPPIEPHKEFLELEKKPESVSATAETPTAEQPTEETISFFKVIGQKIKSIFNSAYFFGSPAVEESSLAAKEKLSLFQYEMDRNNSAEIIKQSCAKISELVKLSWPSGQWIDALRDSQTGEVITISLPPQYVLGLCGSMDTAKIISNLAVIKNEAENVWRVAEEIAPKPPSFVRYKIIQPIFNFFQPLFEIGANPEVTDKNDTGAKVATSTKDKATSTEDKDTGPPGVVEKPCCVCTIIELNGRADIIFPGKDWQDGKVGDIVTEGTNISTGFDTNLKISCVRGDSPPIIHNIGSLSQFTFSNLFCSSVEALKAALRLDAASLRAEVEKGEAKRVDFKVKTPVLTCSVRG